MSSSTWRFDVIHNSSWQNPLFPRLNDDGFSQLINTSFIFPIVLSGPDDLILLVQVMIHGLTAGAANHRHTFLQAALKCLDVLLLGLEKGSLPGVNNASGISNVVTSAIGYICMVLNGMDLNDPSGTGDCIRIFLCWLIKSDGYTSPIPLVMLLFDFIPFSPVAEALLIMAIRGLQSTSQPNMLKAGALFFLVLIILKEERDVINTQNQVPSSQGRPQCRYIIHCIERVWGGPLMTLMAVVVKNYWVLDEWQKSGVELLLSALRREDLHKLTHIVPEDLLDIYCTTSCTDHLRAVMEDPQVRKVVARTITKCPYTLRGNALKILWALFTVHRMANQVLPDHLAELHDPTGRVGMWRNIMEGYNHSDSHQRQLLHSIIRVLYHHDVNYHRAYYQPHQQPNVMRNGWGFPSDLKAVMVQRIDLMEAVVWEENFVEAESVTYDIWSQRHQIKLQVNTSRAQWLMDGVAGSPSRYLIGW